MTYLAFRWLFLGLTLASAGVCLLFGATPARLAVGIASGLLWMFLSRRKARSLDRAVLGVPPRA